MTKTAAAIRAPLRVLLFATHPNSSNGYSKVAYELAVQLSKMPDIALTYYGFQNFHRNPAHEAERVLPSNVEVYDAHKHETEPKQMGFGFDQVTDFVTANKPDVCVIYNDMVVVSTVLDGLKRVPEHARNFKVAVYLDQVYLCQRKEHVKRLNDDADFVICFSEYWQTCIREQGLTRPTAVLQHGFNPRVHYPIPKRLARLYFNLPLDDFIIVNANRNQPRKRLDVMMMAFAAFVARHVGEPVKLVIATAPSGAWNLVEVYERELQRHGVTAEQGLRHVAFIDRPQALTDEDINVLYNASDVGINTAMGEGWGLCNFEAAAIGVPQIVPDIGGFKDFFDKDAAMLVPPRVRLYTDMTIDGCPGCAEVCDAADFADALETYYADADLRRAHAEAARRRILERYRWEDLGRAFAEQLRTVAGRSSVDADRQRLVSLRDIEASFGSDIEEEPSALVPAPKNKPQLRKKRRSKDAHSRFHKRPRAKPVTVYEADDDTSDSGQTDGAGTISAGACMPANACGPQGSGTAQSPPRPVPTSATSPVDVASMSADELVALREQLDKALRLKG